MVRLGFSEQIINFFAEKIDLLKKKFSKNDVIIKNDPGKYVLIKYIFKELFSYFFVAFLFLFVIFFANQILLIGEKLLKQRAPLKDVILIMIYSMPSIIAQSAPYATLIGFLMCLGRMMSDNEILILRASGFGYKYVLVPVVILGFVISIVSFFVNDYLMPLSKIKYNKIYSKIIRSNPTIVLEPNSIKKIGNSTVVIGDVNENNVSDVIFFTADSGEEESIIVAGQSNLKESKSQGVILQLDMSDATMLSIKNSNKNSYDVIKSDNIVMNIFDNAVISMSGKSASEMTFKDLKKEIKAMEEDNISKFKINIWKMDYYKKFAIPFGSIFFAVLAFTIAFLYGRFNGLTMGLFTGVVICVLYWALQISGQLLVVRVHMNSFWCIWIPNFLIGIATCILGIALVRK